MRPCSGRRQASGEGTSVSLFPFLAVLICTMGSLIVLLVITVQQAGDSSTGAEQPAELVVEPAVIEPKIVESAIEESEPLQLQLLQPGEDELTELLRDKDDLVWRAENLASSRESTLARLREQQLQLSMVEDQSQSVRKRLERLRDEVERLKRAGQDQLHLTEDSESQLETLQSKIVDAKRQLAETRGKVQQQRFTIIPRKGTNGTNRRPIYVECLPDRVVLQPEGIVLDTSDFKMPIGPENALASALRAKREFLLNAGVVASAGEPYPLLLVRPGSEKAYAACRHALTGWDEDFGYELVPGEMQLAYPPSDTKLAGFMKSIIHQVRTRLEILAAHEQSESNGVVLGISRETGGFVPTGGVSADGVASGGTAASRDSFAANKTTANSGTRAPASSDTAHTRPSHNAPGSQEWQDGALRQENPAHQLISCRNHVRRRPGRQLRTKFKRLNPSGGVGRGQAGKCRSRPW